MKEGECDRCQERLILQLLSCLTEPTAADLNAATERVYPEDPGGTSTCGENPAGASPVSSAPGGVETAQLCYKML